MRHDEISYLYRRFRHDLFDTALDPYLDGNETIIEAIERVERDVDMVREWAERRLSELEQSVPNDDPVGTDVDGTPPHLATLCCPYGNPHCPTCHS